MNRKAKLAAGIVIAAVVLVLGITLGVTVSLSKADAQPIIVTDEQSLVEAFSARRDKTIVLGCDITVSGDLELAHMNDFDLYGSTLTVNGDIRIGDDADDGEYFFGGDGDTEDGVPAGTLIAENITVNAPNAHIDWYENLSADSLTVTTAENSFVFRGTWIDGNGDAAKSSVAITLRGGNLVIGSDADNVTYNVTVASGADSARVENAVTGENSFVVISASSSVKVAGSVSVSAASGAENVAVDTEDGADVTLTDGTFGSVTGSAANVTINAGVTVSGNVSADKVTNNGTVNGIITDGETTYICVTDYSGLIAALESDVPVVKFNSDITIENKSDIAVLNGYFDDANGSVTLDLCGNIFTLGALNAAESDDASVGASNGFELRIINGTLNAYNCHNMYQANACFAAAADSAVTLEDLKINATGSLMMPTGYGASVALINSEATVSGYYGIATNAGDADNYGVSITVTNSNLKVERDDGDTTGILLNVTNTLTITDSTVSAQRQGVFLRAGNATITNSHISADLVLTNYIKYNTDMSKWTSGNNVAQGALVVGNNRNNAYLADAVVTMTGGSLTCTTEVSALKLYTSALVAAQSDGTDAHETNITLSDVDITGNVVNYDNRSSIIGLPSDVETITSYADTAEKLTAALTGGGTVILTNDIILTDSITVKEGITAILDLNGYKIESRCDGYLLVNEGTLTVNDSSDDKSGIVCNTSEADDNLMSHFILRNSGMLTVNGGTFGDTDTDRTNDNTLNWGAALINLENGTAVLNGGYFTCGDNYWAGKPNGSANYSYAVRSYGELTINDATVYGKMNGGVAADAGEIIINGGDFSVSGSRSYYVAVTSSGTSSTITINGGTFTKTGGYGDILGGFSGMPSWDASEDLEGNGYYVTGGTFIKDGVTVEFTAQQ